MRTHDAPSYVPPSRHADTPPYRHVERADASDAVYDEAVTDRRVTTRYLESLPARVNAVLFAVLAALEGLLALRFVFAAFGASRASGFVDFIYDISWPFVRPFSNAFTNRAWDRGVIEYNTLLAMGVYLLLFVLVMLLVNAVLPRFEEGGTTVRRSRVTRV